MAFGEAAPVGVAPTAAAAAGCPAVALGAADSATTGTADGLSLMSAKDGFGFIPAKDGLGFMPAKDGLGFMPAKDGVGLMSANDGAAAAAPRYAPAQPRRAAAYQYRMMWRGLEKDVIGTQWSRNWHRCDRVRMVICATAAAPATAVVDRWTFAERWSSQWRGEQTACIDGPGSSARRLV